MKKLIEIVGFVLWICSFLTAGGAIGLVIGWAIIGCKATTDLKAPPDARKVGSHLIPDDIFGPWWPIGTNSNAIHYTNAFGRWLTVKTFPNQAIDFTWTTEAITNK